MFVLQGLIEALNAATDGLKDNAQIFRAKEVCLPPWAEQVTQIVVLGVEDTQIGDRWPLEH